MVIMLRKPKNKLKTIAEKVEELLSKREDNESPDEEENSLPKVTDFDEEEYELPDARSTEIRKRNVKLLSEQSSRYAGRVSSRKDFEIDTEDDSAESVSDEDQNEDNFDDDSELEEEFSVSSNQGEEDEDMEDEEEESDLEEDEDEDGESDIEDVEGEETKVISKTNLEAEIRKGVCVQNQLKIWERLLELRIQMQKVVSKANQLPLPSVLNEAKDDNGDLKSVADDVSQNVGVLLNGLLRLQKACYSQQSEIRDATKQTLKRAASFSPEEPINKKMASEHLSAQFEEFRPYRNNVLLKWDDRTRLLTAKTGAKKNVELEQFDIIKKIDNTLLNKGALIEKSQSLKAGTETDTTSNNDSESSSPPLNPNVYDDTDFYHQQLRELIEYKTNTSASLSEVTKQFMELQKLRQKIKKKVDTKASKGRKLRYAVHNKLINFMAPNDTSTWTEEAIDELTKSLFV